MRITGLFVYPIKSGPAVAVPQAQALERGLAFDRRFMVTDASGKFLSQRTHAVLGRVSLSIEGDALAVGAEGVGAFRCPLEPGAGEEAAVRIWSDAVTAHGVSAEADAFFSELVGAQARLVYMPDRSRRPISGFEEMAVSFADGFPILVTNTASLVDLNRRIEGDDVPMAAFRPNVVVEGPEAWSEDDWGELAFADATLRCTSGCERCSMTTLDPAAPDRPRPDGEPLRTLAKFRRDSSGKVIFGRNALVQGPGLVQVGDTVS